MNNEAANLKKLYSKNERDQSAQLMTLADDMGVGLWDWDWTTDEVYFSPGWKRQLGYADHELPNAYGEWESRLHPDDLGPTRNAVSDFRDGRRPAYDAEFRLRHRDGSWRWIFARAQLVRDASGRPVRMMGCHLDVTDRKRTESLLDLQKDVLEAIASGLPLSASLADLTRRIELHASGAICSILLADASRKHLHHGAAPSLPDEYCRAIDGVAIGPNVGCCGTAAYRLAQVVVTDIATDPLWEQYRPLALKHGLRACW